MYVFNDYDTLKKINQSYTSYYNVYKMQGQH
jgi:hypothetical protein